MGGTLNEDRRRRGREEAGRGEAASDREEHRRAGREGGEDLGVMASEALGQDCEGVVVGLV